MTKVFHAGSFQLNLLFQKDQSNTKGEELPSLTNFCTWTSLESLNVMHIYVPQIHISVKCIAENVGNGCASMSQCFTPLL